MEIGVEEVFVAPELDQRVTGLDLRIFRDAG
jgi:hypothetical protein